MCKVIVVTNAKSDSFEKVARGMLKSIGANMVAMVQLGTFLNGAVLPQADVVAVNKPGINGRRDEIGGKAAPLEAVDVTMFSGRNRNGENDLSGLVQWIRRKQPKPKPAVVAQPVEVGPPCVVCGAPVTRKASNGSGWLKTCSYACTTESRKRGVAKATEAWSKSRRAAHATHVGPIPVIPRTPPKVVVESPPTPTQPTTALARFSYNGTPIHDSDDGFLNLTDMWRAAGSPANQRPADWLKTEQAKAFVEFIEDREGVANGPLLRPIPGNPRTGDGGGTEAHWQYAFAYAKYLSPAFHYWCNQVVKAYYEGKLVPAEDDSLVHVLAKATDARLAKQQVQIAETAAAAARALKAADEANRRAEQVSEDLAGIKAGIFPPDKPRAETRASEPLPYKLGPRGRVILKRIESEAVARAAIVVQKYAATGIRFNVADGFIRSCTNRDVRDKVGYAYDTNLHDGRFSSLPDRYFDDFVRAIVPCADLAREELEDMLKRGVLPPSSYGTTKDRP